MLSWKLTTCSHKWAGIISSTDGPQCTRKYRGGGGGGWHGGRGGGGGRRFEVLSKFMAIKWVNGTFQERFSTSGFLCRTSCVIRQEISRWKCWFTDDKACQNLMWYSARIEGTAAPILLADLSAAEPKVNSGLTVFLGVFFQEFWTCIPRSYKKSTFIYIWEYLQPTDGSVLVESHRE